MRVALTAAVAVAFLILSVPAGADIPQVMSYQGKVTDTGGTPVADGTYNMQFDIYHTATGGTALWSSGTVNVQVTSGVFSILLGENPQPTLNLDFDDDCWIEVTIESDVQSPRQQLGSVGYAYMASGLVPGTEVSGSVTSSPFAAIKGANTATSGDNYGVYGVSASVSGFGVYGNATATSGETYGLYGQSNSTEGGAVYGRAGASTGTTYGICGLNASTDGRGVYGYAFATSGVTFGVYGKSSSTSGLGLFGHVTASSGENYGVCGMNSSTEGGGVYGIAPATSGYTYGLYGESNSTDGRGVYGCTSASSGFTYGGWFEAASTIGRGVYSFASATSGVNYGIFGATNSPSGYGGYFFGDVHVAGSLSKGSGSFLIDHPLDPENKLLRHNFVESPENLLVYRGRVRLDENGEAVVRLPHYFAALVSEDEATVTLTPIGKPFLFGYEIEPDNTSFRVYGEANRDVSWVVYANRDDPVIHQLARPVEEDKGPDNKYCDRGRLLYPTAYGYPESMGRDYELREKERREMEEE